MKNYFHTIVGVVGVGAAVLAVSGAITWMVTGGFILPATAALLTVALAGWASRARSRGYRE